MKIAVAPSFFACVSVADFLMRRSVSPASSRVFCKKSKSVILENAENLAEAKISRFLGGWSLLQSWVMARAFRKSVRSLGTKR